MKVNGLLVYFRKNSVRAEARIKTCSSYLYSICFKGFRLVHTPAVNHFNCKWKTASSAKGSFGLWNFGFYFVVGTSEDIRGFQPPTESQHNEAKDVYSPCQNLLRGQGLDEVKRIPAQESSRERGNWASRQRWKPGLSVNFGEKKFFCEKVKTKFSLRPKEKSHKILQAMMLWSYSQSAMGTSLSVGFFLFLKLLQIINSEGVDIYTCVWRHS